MRHSGFDQQCTCVNRGLGEENQADLVIQNIIESARQLFPEQTAEFENWVAARAANYGINYARYKAAQTYGTLTEWLSNPIVLLGLGIGAGWLMFKRR